VAAIEAWRTARQARLSPGLDLTTERAKLAKVQRQLTSLKLREARGELVRAKDAADVQRSEEMRHGKKATLYHLAPEVTS